MSSRWKSSQFQVRRNSKSACAHCDHQGTRSQINPSKLTRLTRNVGMVALKTRDKYVDAEFGLRSSADELSQSAHRIDPRGKPYRMGYDE